MIEKLFECTEELLAKHHVESSQLTGLGISCGGPLDHEAGVLIRSPPNLIGWDRVEDCEIV